MKYVKTTKVKEHVHARGKRVTRGFMLWLDHRVEAMLDRHMNMIGSRSTLDAEDAALLCKVE